MENRPSQSLGKVLLILSLASFLRHGHCVNISLVNVPLVSITEQSCIDIPCRDQKMTPQISCGGNDTFCPAVETVFRKQTIYFTGTNQGYFKLEGRQIEQKNLSDCEILNIEDAVNISCSASNLPSGSSNLVVNQTLMSVELRCNNGTKKQQKLCLIFRNSSVEMEKLDNQTASPNDNSILYYIKKHMIVISVAVGAILLIIIAVLVNHIRKLVRGSKNESTPGVELDVAHSNGDSVYHEPNNHTYIDIDETSPRNYAYAYGHVDPVSPRRGRQGPGEMHDYINIEQLPDERESNKDYINVGEDDTDYVDMKTGYQALDRSSMVSDDAMYQGLVEKNGVRPKIAPKPRHLPRVDESREVSYLKVL